MTPEPTFRYRKKPTPIRNALLVFFATLSACQTGFIAYEFGQRQAQTEAVYVMQPAEPVQLVQASTDCSTQTDYVTCMQRQLAETPPKKGAKR